LIKLRKTICSTARDTAKKFTRFIAISMIKRNLLHPSSDFINSTTKDIDTKRK
jgi:hypothetical protein